MSALVNNAKLPLRPPQKQLSGDWLFSFIFLPPISPEKIFASKAAVTFFINEPIDFSSKGEKSNGEIFSALDQ